MNTPVSDEVLRYMNYHISDVRVDCENDGGEAKESDHIEGLSRDKEIDNLIAKILNHVKYENKEIAIMILNAIREGFEAKNHEIQAKHKT